MKKKSLKLRWPHFFSQRINRADVSGSMPELIKPASEWDKTENLNEDILRWADDGGRVLELGNRKNRSTPDAAANRSNK